MKNKLLFIILLILLIAVFLPSYAYGDMGPKPSVIVDFEGLEGQTYYVTLLSVTSSTGPHSAFAGHNRYMYGDENVEVWEKFQSYKDENGYYFLQYFYDCSETSQFRWGYYPPGNFKILIYFPDLDTFAVTESHAQYAFKSYYKVDLSNIELIPSTSIDGIKAEMNYNFTWEIISLVARIIGTIAIEILVAFMYGYRKKNQLRVIVKINIATQVILNIFLNVVNFFTGSMLFVVSYVLGEIVVILIEITVYSGELTKFSTGQLSKKQHATTYAIFANAVSFYVGLLIAKAIPGIY